MPRLVSVYTWKRETPLKVELLKEFGSSKLVRAASEDQLAAVAGRAAARRIKTFYEEQSVSR